MEPATFAERITAVLAWEGVTREAARRAGQDGQRMGGRRAVSLTVESRPSAFFMRRNGVVLRVLPTVK
ncbi:hypothetical protein JOD27_007688 [Lentzea nigeriaca]|nr:hypothetical protein [Lentzea nigeriaca]